MDFFNEYTKNYDMSIPHISYKYYHSIRVMDNMELLAKNLHLPYCDIELAKCIGLLHDIGRFEQFKRFRSYSDKFLDHGDFGSNLLKELDALKNYKISPDDYDVVYKAIRNHNKFAIESNLNERETLFSKMIRDADKLDIFYALGDNKLKEIVYEDNSEISKHVDDDFFSNKLVKKQNNETVNDNIICLLSFIFDLNFDISLYIIKKYNYHYKIYERLNNKEKFKKYIEHIDKYLEKRNA